MAIGGLSKNITEKYHPLEAWIYDRYIACAITQANIFGNVNLNNLPDNAKVIDIGCGGGQLAIALATEHPNYEITGLDLSEAQIERATLRNKKAKTNINFVPGNVLHLPFKDNSFDFVYSIASIKHWSDKEKGISECIRVLKPGGLLLIMEVDKNCSDEEIKVFVDQTQFPTFIKPLWRRIFRAKVARPSLSKEEMKAIVKKFNLSEWEVKAVDNSFSFGLTGKK